MPYKLHFIYVRCSGQIHLKVNRPYCQKPFELLARFHALVSPQVLLQDGTAWLSQHEVIPEGCLVRDSGMADLFLLMMLMLM